MANSILASLVAAALSFQSAQAPDLQEALWDAARAGNQARVAELLDNGVDVNAKTRYGTTALTFAAGAGHTALVTYLLGRGAEVNLQDTFYQMRAIDLALSNNHVEAARVLLEKGSRGGANALMTGIRTKNAALVKAALAAPDITAGALRNAEPAATKAGDEAILAMVKEKAAAMPPEPAATVTVDPAVLQTYVGTYRNDSGLSVEVAVKEGRLVAQPAGQPALPLTPTSQTSFRPVEFEGLSMTFAGRGGMIETLTVVQGNQTFVLPRVTAAAAAAAAASANPAAAKPAGAPATPDSKPAAAASKTPAARTTARPWPGFRGANASGNGDGQGAVVEWDAAAGKNVKWKTPIPGFANASPIVWGSRVFVVTAISSAGEKTFRTGLYGDVKPVEDLSEHTWKLYALDKATGRILWERDVHKGAPKVKRHTKATQANSTPVTDGTHVVVLFGSIGMLAAYKVDGTPAWTKDVGVMDSGWFFDSSQQWGHSSSPVIHGQSVIVQADQQKGSFIAAYDIASGKELWRTARPGEIPTWGTPAVFSGKGGDVVVTNGTKVRGYDAKTGKELWTLAPNSEVTVATPVVGPDLVYVTGGYPPVRPVYAVRPSATGDISLPKGQAVSEAIAWSNGEGTYIPTPILYGGRLYTCSNNGVITAYDAATGERVHRGRVGTGGAFSASPVAADGRLYFATEDGDIFVIEAGGAYAELAKNSMGEVIMATPAISDGLIFVRTLGHVWGIGQ